MFPFFFLFLGAIHIRPHADNFFAVFPSTEAAVRAALWMKAALDHFNKGRDADNKAVLGGIGIASGCYVGALDQDLRGVPAVEAFLLGEIVADHGDVLLNDRARKDIFPEDQHERLLLHVR